jgi:CheY-like chemotaxis protein
MNRDSQTLPVGAKGPGGAGGADGADGLTAQQASAKAPGADSDRGSAAPAGGGRRILVVDDNQDGAELLAELLQELGHVVKIAHDGPAALAASQQFHPDIALVDIGLPDMDGYEVARRLRDGGSSKQLRLVAISGYDLDPERDRAVQAGFQRHLLKPVDFNQLEQVIKELHT